MLFDHDAEIGAFLFLNVKAAKIEGYLYRIDEIKETEEKEKENDKGVVTKIKEEVTIRRDYYVMDVQGNWFKISESTNPFLYYLPRFIESGYAEDKTKLPWPYLAGWIEGNFISPADNSVMIDTYIPHEIKDIDPEKDHDAYVAKLDTYRIRYDTMQESVDWIMKSLQPNEQEVNDQKFDPTKKLLRELDKFEYDIGDKK